MLLALLKRIQDKTSYGRKEVITVFQIQVTKNCIPIDFYPLLLDKVLERLRDNSSNVRKAALKLFGEIVKIHETFLDVPDN